MIDNGESIVERIVVAAIRLGADLVEIECKAGYEEVVAAKAGVGQSVARLRSSSPEAFTLREELYRIAKRKCRITVDENEYELRCGVFDSFGEDAFQVALRRVVTARVSTHAQGHPTSS
jgi:hypothetical protein